MKVYGFLAACVGLLALATGAQAKGLKERLQEVIEGRRAEVGIAVIVEHKDTVCVNNHGRYPLMSVFKLHQAIAVAHECGRRGVSLDTVLHIGREELLPQTWSPLREEHPEGEVRMPVARLLQYTLQQSDNNACDILFRHLLSPAETDAYLRSLGLREFAICHTEEEMHRRLEACYENWSTPLEVARLVEWLFGRELVEGEMQRFLQQTLLECQTGLDRLPSPLRGTGAAIAHKTGTGDRNERRVLMGLNDAGMVRLPDGREYTVVVLVKDSQESDADTAALIAQVSRVVYRYVTGQHPRGVR